MAPKQDQHFVFSLEFLLLLFLSLLLLAGLTYGSPLHNLSQFWTLQSQPARLLHDFIDSAGIGAAFINAAIVGFIGLGLIFYVKIPLSGPTFAAVLTMTGFALFGKTAFNILPVILGVGIAAKSVRKTLADYLIIALFGTALGPLVNLLAWESGLPSYFSLPLGVFGGLLAGYFLPAVAMAMLHMHQGYNLYNTGFACGFLALFISSILKGISHPFMPILFWKTEEISPLAQLLIPSLAMLLLAQAFASNWAVGKSVRSLLVLWKKEILDQDGRLPSDFCDMASKEASMLNSGVLGLSLYAYLYLVNAPFNGPIIGALLTVMGFSAFGIHIKNSWPVFVGIMLATLLSGSALDSPGPLLAIIFGLTLAPLAGQFGIAIGVLAGMIHFFMVSQTAEWSGSINLYNNGFAGGLTATLIVSFIEWLRANRKKR